MKILYVTTISLTMNSFFKPHIEMLVREGHQVDIACNYKDLSLDGLYTELGCSFHQVDFSRSPLSPHNLKAYKQLKRVVAEGDYDVVHCHTPNASVITRLVCRKPRRKQGLKVFYTAHGFHFYKGAPKLNWMVYYPIEKFCSRFTDKLITINKEDYKRAKTKFKAKETLYVPGVGVDLSRFENVKVDKTAKRQEINVPDDAFLMFSVGELNENKNHQIIIKAIARLDDPSIHYAIAGVGDKKDCLTQLSKELGVSDRVHLLGYRKDIAELNRSADLFCFPSFREGLAVSVIEAMACGLPIACSGIRGNTDLIDENGGMIFNPASVDEAQNAIASVMNGDMQSMGKYNSQKSKSYGLENVKDQLKEVYHCG